MPRYFSCLSHRNRFGGLLIFTICIATFIVIYSNFQYGPRPPLVDQIANFGQDITNKIRLRIIQPPEVKPSNITELIKQYRLSHAPWMDTPIVNPFPYKFVHNPRDACANKEVEILIASPVARSNFEERRAVRETWGSYAQDRQNNAVLLFFLGSGSEGESPEIQTKIDEESSVHKDIVQVQFLDTYRNLTTKSVSILRWMDAYCPNASYVSKVDDDMYVVVPRLVQKLRETSKKLGVQPFVMGVEIVGAVPVQDKSSKWYTPKKDFPEKVYPKYVSGTAYTMGGKAARLLFQATLRTPLFWLEDIYITGLCSRKAGVKIVNDWKQTFTKPKAAGCQFKKFITGHRYKVPEIRKIHQELYDKNLKCP